MTRIRLDDDWAVRAPAGPFGAVQAALARPTPVRLPHDALRDADRAPSVPGRGAGAYYPRAAFTYVRGLDVPEDWAHKVVRLEFGGAMRKAMVFVNDEFAANRADGYARFHTDITALLRYGTRNELRVEVRVGEDSRWYSGAGLHRSVYLHVDEPVHVEPDGIRITTLDLEADQAVVEIVTRVRNAGLVTASLDVGNEVTGPGGATVASVRTPLTVPPGTTQALRQRLVVTDPSPWSPEDPRLHTLRTSLGEAEPLITEFGIRTVRVDARRGLRINGRSVKLRGACIHHDNGPLGAAAIDRAEERRIELLREAGFNAVRSAHNPVSPAMLAACDRLGMLVMDEAFDMWTRFKSVGDYSADFPQWWAADLEALVAKDYNHPSVIMYSLGNEIVEVGTPHGAVLARTMAEHVRALDPTRPVTNGVNSLLAVMDELAGSAAADPAGLNELMSGDLGEAMSAAAAGENVSRRTAESHAALDVVGLNYGESRYPLDADLFPHRAIVGSETFPTRIGRLWPMVERYPHVIGDFTWTGWDYLGEAGIGATAYAGDADAVPALEREYPFLTAWCGDLDITGFRRPASYYREVVFGLRSEPYVAVRRPAHHDRPIAMQSPWAWSDSVSSWTWPRCEGPVTVEVYAAADEVVLQLDGREVGRAREDAARPRLFLVETSYAPGTLTAVAYRDGAEIGRTALVTAGAPRLTATADRTVLSSGPGDLAFVAVEFADAEGRLVCSADAEVTVEVTGSAVLAGMCSANPKTAERFDSPTWRTFDGRALAVVRPTEAGAVTVTVTADGFDEVTIELEVKP